MPYRNFIPHPIPVVKDFRAVHSYSKDSAAIGTETCDDYQDLQNKIDYQDNRSYQKFKGQIQYLKK